MLYGTLRAGLLLTGALALFTTAFAQNARIATADAEYRVVRFAEPSTSKAALAAIADALELAPQTDWLAGRTSQDAQGARHERYAQRHAGVPVLGGEYVVHHYATGATVATGRAVRLPDDLPTGADVDAAAAQRRAVRHYRDLARARDRQPVPSAARPTDRRALRRARAEMSRERIDVEGAPRLVIVNPAYPRAGGTYRLAYEVTVAASARRDRQAMYIDAATGRPLTQVPLVAHATVPGSGESTYYGNVALSVDSLAPDRYALSDASRGGNAVYLDGYGQEIEHTARDFGTAVPSVAVDVHHGTEMFYDMLETRFGWRGLDGAGLPFEAVVYGSDEGDFVNAFWNGVHAAFGNGNCHYEPLTSLDVVGHEFMHGVTDYTSDLVYADESGALNEGMSDIFGKGLELLVDPAGFSWTLGNRFADSPYARSFRSMSNPNAFDNPKVYRGDLWEDGAGVHTNSGPFGHWFYLLVEGGAGTNDLGDAYDVAAVGVEVALAHTFALQRDYLTSASGYADAFASSMALAEAAYGAASAETAAIEQAWRAIGCTDARVSGSGGGGGGGGGAHDLGVIGISFGTDACQAGTPLALDLLLENLGDSTLTQGAELRFAITLDGTTESVVATAAAGAQPGQHFIAAAQTAFVIGVDDFAFFEIELLEPDDNASNNETRDFFQVYPPDQPFIYGYIEAEEVTACASQSAGALEVQLYNDGCAASPGGTYVLRLDDGGATATEVQFPVPPLEVFDFAQVNVPVDFAALAGGGEFEAYVYDAAGAAPLFPSSYLDVTTPPTLAVPAAVALASEEAFDTLDRIANPYYNLDLGIVEHRGRSWWGTTGESFGVPRAPCFEPDETYSPWRATSLAACVDFSALGAEVYLSAEVMRLGSAYANDSFPELAGQFSMLRVGYETGGAGPGEVFFADLPDREVTRVEAVLPAGYAGPITLSTYNHVGLGSHSFDGTFGDESDYLLLRDVRLTTVSTGTRELATERATLTPNPATDRTTLTLAADGDYAVRVVDALGATVLRAAFVGDRVELPVARLVAGVYTVVAEDHRAGRRFVGRLVR